MHDLPPGWATDLAVAELKGSLVEEHGDHLILRTPSSPEYHWGHVVLVTDRDAVGDAERWVETFHAAFPEAGWIAIGLIELPADVAPWRALGLEPELEDVLTTRTPPRRTPTPDGYVVRELEGDDWEQLVEQAVAENDETGEHDPVGYGRFTRVQMERRRSLCERGLAAYFGAFADGRLAASLGIVRLGRRARYQQVGTAAAHRRRGLASHLLGVAGNWAAEAGCEQWVIVTDVGNPAGRVYRAAGFAPDVGNAQVYRKPPRVSP